MSGLSVYLSDILIMYFLFGLGTLLTDLLMASGGELKSYARDVGSAGEFAVFVFRAFCFAVVVICLWPIFMYIYIRGFVDTEEEPEWVKRGMESSERSQMTEDEAVKFIKELVDDARGEGVVVIKDSNGVLSIKKVMKDDSNETTIEP